MGVAALLSVLLAADRSDGADASAVHPSKGARPARTAFPEPVVGEAITDIDADEAGELGGG